MLSAPLLNHIQETKSARLNFGFPLFCRYTYITSLETAFRLHKRRMCPAGFEVNFYGCVCFHLLVERIPLSASINCFELKFQLK